jgi:Ca2+/Na+ antiporter
MRSAGTSTPDALATIYVAREGQGTMAIANAFGSNIFDILFGLGLPFLVSTIMSGGALEVDVSGILNSTILLAALLVFFLLWVAFSQFRIGRKWGWVLIAMYAAYILAVCMKWL